MWKEPLWILFSMDIDTVIEVDNLKKKYKLGTIGGGTLRGEIQSRIALMRGREDPNSIIGQSGNYNKEFWAVKGIDFQVKRGERLGIIGHNGAGKSTLLKMLSRITAPTEGRIRIRGRITSMLEVGTGFHGELTGRENIYLNAAILGMTKKEVDEKIDDIIAFSECEEFIDTPVKRYSSGMYVKLAFSVAAHLDSEIMIMDEVLAVGDVGFQNKCLSKMREIADNENRTILYVSHNMATIRKLCDRCIVLDHGKIIYDGNVNKAIEIYLSSGYSDEGEAFYNGPRRDKENARILDLRFEGHDEEKVVIEGDSKQILCAKVNAYEPINGAHFRLLIRFMDTSVAGTFFTKAFSFKTPGKYRVQLEVPLKNLPESNYYIQAVLSKANIDGTNIKYSQIDLATQFEIQRKTNNCSGLNWNNGWRVNLGELESVVKEEPENRRCKK